MTPLVLVGTAVRMVNSTVGEDAHSTCWVMPANLVHTCPLSLSLALSSCLPCVVAFCPPIC